MILLGKLLKRLRWRWKNLTKIDLINSYISVETIKLPNLDIGRYDSYSKDDIDLLEDYSPFILIKPSGVEHEDKIKLLLENQVEKEETIYNYRKLGLSLYHRPHHKRGHTLNSYLWFALDEYLYPDKLDKTKILFLNKDPENLRDFKKQVRLNIGHIKFYKVLFNELEDKAFSSFIHISDKEDLPREYSILMDYLKNERRT